MQMVICHLKVFHWGLSKTIDEAKITTHGRGVGVDRRVFLYDFEWFFYGGSAIRTINDCRCEDGTSTHSGEVVAIHLRTTVSIPCICSRV